MPTNPHTRYMTTTQNITAKAYHVLHPGPLAQKNNQGHYSTLAYADDEMSSKGYVTLSDIRELDDQGLIDVVEVSGNAAAAAYGRVLVRYVIL